MTKMQWRIVATCALATLVGTSIATAQGTRDPRGAASGTAQQPAGGGMATNASPDPMGGAFKGTGTPTFGTSAGMGASGSPRRN